MTIYATGIYIRDVSQGADPVGGTVGLRLSQPADGLRVLDFAKRRNVFDTAARLVRPSFSAS